MSSSEKYHELLYAFCMVLVRICKMVALIVVLVGCRAHLSRENQAYLEEQYSMTGDEYERLGTSEAYALYAYGELLAERGSTEEAIAYFASASKADSSDAYLRVRLALSLIQIGRYKRARRILEKAINRDSSDEYAWLAMAKYHAARGHSAQKEAAAARAMGEEPGRVEAALWLAREYEKSGDYGRAAEILRRVVAVDRVSAEVHLAFGRVSLAMGDYGEAQVQLTKFVTLMPHRADVIADLSQAYLKAGEKAGSAKLVALALSKEPTDVALRLRLIHLYLELGQSEKATRHLHSLPPTKPDDTEGVILRACLYAKANRPYEARDLMVSHLGASPEIPEARFVLAELEVLLGRLEVARLLLGDEGDVTGRESELRKTVLDELEMWPRLAVPCLFLSKHK